MKEDYVKIPLTTRNGIRVRQYTNSLFQSTDMIPYDRGQIVLRFNIALDEVGTSRILKGKEFMDLLEERSPKEAYLFSLGYFGGHDFVLDLNY